ncbi:nucleoside triphosphate pyrophosphohydrolase [Terracoccus luteus]|uniref:XTP/dITP diphosphohydrolase n=1 Tax=Terracoccus luteus TaxID=53356 RepID=A0A839PUM6_9MICO|nr:MazG family protein [Terracoccus luteus]MBB2985686.1 XTP/dITP diphosphohydrolase [Terracoccus luteus]MCP2171338.1 XTP/dITP diphosphohydrolase [Terracoccus luteus]
MPGRVVVLVSSPRVAPGLLSREAWSALERADTVHARRGEPQAAAVVEAGLTVTLHGADGSLGADGADDVQGTGDPAALARELVSAASADDAGDVVWVGSSDGDPGLNEAVAVEVTRLPEPPEVELLVASWDVPGARLLDVVAVMDRLRSPGGCPWDAEQTHETLVPYLLEEAHEAIEAIESGDRVHMEEELGDLLLQVAFHARVAQEHPEAPFDVDDVAGTLVEKLVRRHPHVFGDVEVDGASGVEANWESIKATEKAGRTHVLDGIPVSMPALARAQKAVTRLDRAGRGEVTDAVLASGTGQPDLGRRLLALVREARAAGVDAESALRQTLVELTTAADPR